MNKQRVILIEFNELCPPLLKRWMGEGHLPNFSRFYADSEIFVTESDEPAAPNLEPWIQWYSLHTGLPYSKHRVFHLTDGPKADHPDIWQVLQKRGLRVWNCSSMNARRIEGPGAAFLPDPWCDSQAPYPPELGVFHRFVSRQVKEYSNKDRRDGAATIANFVSFLATHGLSASTVMAIARQLLSEVSDRANSWKRVVLLDKMQFDVFRHYFRKNQPDFSTFFVNSTAHLQHTYWRHMEPEAFQIRPSAAEIRRHRDAILFGYQEMDKLVGKFMALAGKDTTLIFATALSQQPYLKYEAIGGHHFYRPRNVEKLVADIGLRPIRIEPVMTHQFVARFRNPAEAAEAELRLSRIRSSQGQVFGFDPAEPGSLYFGCQLRTALAADEKLDLGSNDPAAKFFDHFYQIEGIKSGRHHPDGCLWIRRGLHRVNAEKVSILDVFPTVLDLLDVPDDNCLGQSLVKQEASGKIAKIAQAQQALAS